VRDDHLAANASADTENWIFLELVDRGGPYYGSAAKRYKAGAVLVTLMTGDNFSPEKRTS
jgi:hypothetical protein